MIFFVLVSFICCLTPFLLLMIFIIIRKRNKKFLIKKLKDIQDSSPYRKQQSDTRPNNDFLFLHKENEKDKEKNEEFDHIQKIGVDEELELEEGKIVGVVEPQGFWSKLIMSQKMNFILAKIGASENKGQGFWTNLIKAQDTSQGKNKGRGR